MRVRRCPTPAGVSKAAHRATSRAAWGPPSRGWPTGSCGDLRDAQPPPQVLIAAIENVAPGLLRGRFSHVLVPPTMTGVQFAVVRRRPGSRRYIGAPVARMVAVWVAVQRRAASCTEDLSVVT